MRTEDDVLIRSREVCEMAGGVGRMTVSRWVKRGILPEPIKFSPNGPNFWRRDEVAKCLRLRALSRD